MNERQGIKVSGYMGCGVYALSDSKTILSLQINIEIICLSDFKIQEPRVKSICYKEMCQISTYKVKTKLLENRYQCS